MTVEGSTTLFSVQPARNSLVEVEVVAVAVEVVEEEEEEARNFEAVLKSDLNDMSENYSKSKLKRKKSCVTEYQPEISCRETLKKPTLISAEFTAAAEGSVFSQSCQL